MATMKMYHDPAQQAAKCWYEIRDLQTYLFTGVQTTGYATSCNWILDKLPQWQRLLLKFFSDQHFRRARRRGLCGAKRRAPGDDSGDIMDDGGDADEDDGRKYDEHTMSSFAFVWLLLHLLSEPRHAETIKERSHSLLGVLAKRFVVDDLSIPIVACSEFRCDAGHLPTPGDDRVMYLAVDGGSFYVDELRRLGHSSLWRGFLDLQAPLGGRADFCEVLIHVFAGRARSLWLAAQLVNILGTLMDRDFEARGYLTDPFSSRRILRPKQRRDEEAHRRLAFGIVGAQKVENSSAAASVLLGAGINGAGCADRVEDKQLVRYWLAARQAFDQQQSADICVDSGRVGGVSWQMGAVQANTNHGEQPMVAWAPPQAYVRGRLFQGS